jgi:hypothetical protein
MNRGKIMKNKLLGYLLFAAFLVCSDIYMLQKITYKPRYNAGLMKEHRETSGGKNTSLEIAAVMDYELSANTNVAYAAAFPIAWNTLIKKVTKVKPQFSSDIPLANKLNEQKTGAQDISADAYFAAAGFKKDGIEQRVKSGMKKKFGAAPINDIFLQRPDDILAYAYMDKNLSFGNKFDTNKDFIFTSGNGSKTNIEAFGTEGANGAGKDILVRMITVNHYTPESFVITLKSKIKYNCHNFDDREFCDLKDGNDEIIFAMIPRENTLSATVNKALSLRAEQNIMEDEDELLIPKLDFDVTQEFKELSNVSIINFKNYSISKALETIIFMLDEDGVRVKAEAKVDFTLGMHFPEKKPRKIYFNKPFLVMLKEKNAVNPYFALWVDNADIMKRAENDTNKKP